MPLKIPTLTANIATSGAIGSFLIAETLAVVALDCRRAFG